MQSDCFLILIQLKLCPSPLFSPNPEEKPPDVDTANFEIAENSFDQQPYLSLGEPAMTSPAFCQKSSINRKALISFPFSARWGISFDMLFKIEINCTLYVNPQNSSPEEQPAAYNVVQLAIIYCYRSWNQVAYVNA
ncbi:hypothetical protein T08_16703 [Trichinella sp. T8]|nr:hypothetical protein T08_16703 [Trichinella sp. T8]